MRLLHCCLLLIALTALASCGARSVDAPRAAEFPAISELDSLPRSTSDIQTVNGVDAIASSGAPSAQPHATQADWLVLDGDQASGVAAWAIWRVTLLPGETPQFIDVNLPQNGLRRYWIAYADFTAQRWQFLDTAGNTLGRQGASALLEPAEPSDLLSPGNNMYVAVLVLGGQTPDSKVNVGYLEANYTPVLDPDPIFDDFEDNDTLNEPGNSCYPLPGPGMYHASIHETPQEMNDPNETVDDFDFYCIDVPAGKQLTVTLRHDALNFFFPADGSYNDLDLLFYHDGITDWNQFDESLSSLQLYYGFEQIHASGLSGTYMLGVIAALGDQYEDNAEYDLAVFFSDQTYTVRGRVSQEGTLPTVKFTAFLEPGNFNDVTWFTGDEEAGTRGDFEIRGVPNGEYTLKVQGSAGFNQTGYIYTTTKPVTVNFADENNVDIDIEAHNPP